MKKFLILYTAPTPAREQMQKSTPEEMKKGMEPWMAWKDKLGDKLVDMGMPLGNAMTVTKNDVMPGDAEVVGYSVLQADSIDEAVEMVKNHPHLQWMEGCTVEVHEMMPMPGADTM